MIEEGEEKCGQCRRRSILNNTMTAGTVFATLGMFIIDGFSFFDDEGLPTGKTVAPQGSLAYETPTPLSHILYL